MALIPIRVDRTSKPPLGTPLRSDGHWSVDRLAVCVMLNEGAGGTVYDCASGRNCSATFPGWWNSSFGTSLKFFNYKSQYVDCGPLLSQSSLQEITVETLVLSEDNVGTRMIAEDGSAYNANSFYLAQSDGKFEFEVFGTSYSIVTSASYQVDKWAHVVGTWTAGQPPSIYVNGSMSNESYVGIPQSSLINGNRNLTLGVRPTASSFPYLGNIGFFKLYRSALNPQQIASLSANPWQIYEPETVWVEVGGGAEAALFAGTIYGQSSASAQLSTAIRFGGALSGSSTTTAALTNAITMAAQAAGLGSISGQLAGTVAAALFAGTISGSSSASANLSTAVILAAAAQGNATAQAALATALELAAQVNGLGSASGALGADISGLAGSLSGSSEAQATLSTAIHLMGLAAGQCGVVGRLAEPVEILAQLRVMASDPLALTISVRDPLALRVTVH